MSTTELQKTLTNPSPSRTPSGTASRLSATDGEADDPAEVDISSMFQKPSEDSSQPTQQELLRSMLRTQGPNTPSTDNNSNAGPGDPASDPMVRAMQQMLGGGDGGSGQLPEGLSSLLGLLGEDQEAQKTARSADYVWRIVHAFFSLLLGLYVVFYSPFTGSHAGRYASESDEAGMASRMFWIFATAELLLQSTRYFVDQGNLPPSPILGKIARILPEPYAGYVRVLRRYGVIYTTVVSDAMVFIFMLGAAAWWKGSATV